MRGVGAAVAKPNLTCGSGAEQSSREGDPAGSEVAAQGDATEDCLEDLLGGRHARKAQGLREEWLDQCPSAPRQDVPWDADCRRGRQGVAGLHGKDAIQQEVKYDHRVGVARAGAARLGVPASRS